MNNFNQDSSHQEHPEEVKLVGYSPRTDKLTYRNGNKDNGNIEETEQFISVNSTPVKLDPGLETLDRTTENMLLEKKQQSEPPQDRFRMVFFIFLIHGVGVLMPWNMFITAKAYFEDYKLNTPLSHDAPYRTEFMFYLGIVSQVSNALISCGNTFFQFGGQASTRRIAIALFLMVIVFIFTVVLAMVDTSQVPFLFFCLTMLSTCVLNCCAGVYQNSVFGQAAILPMKYTNAIVLGTNLSGIFTSVINVISIAGSPNPRTAAVYYFIVAIVILLIAFDAYFLLPLTKFYRHFLNAVAKPEVKKNMKMRDYCHGFLTSCKMYWQVMKKIWVQLYGVWCTFAVTLILFPAIQSNIKMVRHEVVSDNGNVTVTSLFSPEFETKGYWVSIFCFLSFNLFAFIGNLSSEFVKWPGPKHVWIPITLRALILIPVFVMCNYQPHGMERSFPVLINNDIVFIIAGIIMAWTSGYFSSLSMMYGPKEVEPEMMGRAGMMMAFFLVLGITSGVNLALGLQRAVTK